MSLSFWQDSLPVLKIIIILFFFSRSGQLEITLSSYMEHILDFVKLSIYCPSFQPSISVSFLTSLCFFFSCILSSELSLSCVYSPLCSRPTFTFVCFISLGPSLFHFSVFSYFSVFRPSFRPSFLFCLSFLMPFLPSFCIGCTILENDGANICRYCNVDISWIFSSFLSF